ncbi:diguanylate cyclase with PAS/PAC sensor [Methylotenera versatilis 301]|uniref:Diguanylate cyclase with PAS/PAC sensor n=2 Tax=Methylotenera TaxID=359407 RepID=D7DL99_METV0|nr:diguanylate cyclase with PAS/PAC sensor [Methylotenera versatilis 301]
MNKSSVLDQLTSQKKVMTYGLLLVLTYVITGKLGLMLALPPGYASAIFPPTGIAVAAVFVAGRKLLPAIFLGSLLLNILVGYSDNHQVSITNIEVALLIAAASTLQAFLGGWWLKHKIGYPTSLDNPADVVTFFISAPVICLISASISVGGLFALGLIGQSLFFTSWASWWIGDSLGLIVMLPLTLVVIGRPRSIWKKRFSTVALPMIITFLLLVIIFIVVSRWERKESLVEFDALSNQLSEQLRIRFDSQEAVLKQTSALFNYRVNDTVSRQDFHHFVSTTLDGYPMIYAIEWAPKVNRYERHSFVEQQEKDFTNFEIKQFNLNKELMTAPEKSFYFPIAYIEPLKEATQAILGVDLASLPDRKQTIQNAINEKKVVATPPIKLIIKKGTELGLLLMYPVHSKTQNGILSIILRVDSFFGELFMPVKQSVEVRLIDMQTGKSLYNGFSESNLEASYTREFKFGNRQYRLETAPTALYHQQHRGWQSWNMLVVGLFGTGLMGALLLMGTGYTARIENLVKQKTEELKESFYLFQEITSTLGEGIYVMNTNGMITFANPKAHALLGRSESELLGQNAHLLFHNKHIDKSVYPECECQIRNVIHSKQPYKSVEEIFWHKNGTPIYSSVTSVPLFRDNEIVGAVVVFDDISERKKIEHALRDSEKSFKEIIEYAPIGMAIVSLSGQFNIVNQTLCNIVGYSNPELLKLTFQEITYHEDLSIDLEFVRQLIDGETDSYQMEKRYIRKDKEIVWVQLSVSIFRNEDDAAQYFIAQIEDITERKIRDNEVHQHAYFDTLTKLPNRRMLMDRLSQELSQAERDNRIVALFFLDLDHFKHINDSLGHDVGDLILKEAALRLLSCVRPNDMVSRLGGDEFVILLSEISDANYAKKVAEKVLRKFEEPIDVNGKEVIISASIGIALRTGDVKITFKQLMKNADMAMYESKATGRNRYYFYNLA